MTENNPLDDAATESSPTDPNAPDAIEISEPIEQASALELAQHLSAPLSVELARLNLTVTDLGSLKSGQVLELKRFPQDAVDLIVAGKLVGKGELVEVEGELGVRILSLVK